MAGSRLHPVPMAAARRVEIRLELDPASDPISGELTDGHGETHDFQGWLQLMAEVDRARLVADEEPSDDA
jgi:hypothetical protein